MVEADEAYEESRIKNKSSKDPLEEAENELERTEVIEGTAVIDELGGKIYAVKVEPDSSASLFRTDDTPYNQIGKVFIYDRGTNELRPAEDEEESFYREHYENLDSENLF